MKLTCISAMAKLIVPLFYCIYLVTVVQAESLRATERSDGIAPSATSRGRLITESPKARYIVAYKNQPTPGTDASLDPSIQAIKAQVESSVEAMGGTILNQYSNALNGFAAILSPELVNTLKENSNIEYMEEDSIVSIASTQESSSGLMDQSDHQSSIVTVSSTQTEDLPWGLDRIDQQSGMDGKYTYNSTGAGVHAYIIDTGISSTHSEFTDRLGNGFNAVTGDASSPQPWDDCHGQGTHVASTVGGTKYGVAKAVTLHSVRVLDCLGYGYNSDIIAGIDWVISEHNKNTGQKSVVNMSIRGSKDTIENQAVTSMVAAGIVVVVSAGSTIDGADACSVSPASADNVLTVGVTTMDDSRASFSGYGPCVEIFAPGVGILGAGHECDTCSGNRTGASPSALAAGVAALHLEKNGGTPAEIISAILSHAVDGIVTDARTPTNKFLQSSLTPINKKCKAVGKTCRRLFCKLSKSCCCSGLQCKRGKCR